MLEYCYRVCQVGLRAATAEEAAEAQICMHHRAVRP